MALSSLTRKTVSVEIRMSDGSDIFGSLMIERGARLSDVLNKSGREFIVVQDFDQKIHIVNKHHIMKICETQAEMTDLDTEL